MSKLVRFSRIMKICKITSEQTIPIRHAVLWPDKPTDFCILPDDAQGLHYGVFFQARLVTVASIYINGKHARLRKFATLENFQGNGCGTTLIQYIIEELSAMEIESLWCDARLTAVAFYNRLGFEMEEAHFLKHGVAYCRMTKHFDLTSPKSLNIKAEEISN